MKKRIAILIAFIVYMLTIMACGAQYDPPVAATPTVINPGEVALTMIMQKADAEATQMAVNVNLTATGQVVNATSTAQAYQFGIATEQQARKDQMATEQQRRDDIAATQAVINAVYTAEQAERNVIGTATAQQQMIHNSMTAQVLPTHAMWTQQAVEQQQIIATNQVELSNLEVKRQQKSNTLQALSPYAVALIGIVAAAIVVLRYSRTREIKNEETGVIEAVLLDNKTMIRPQLLPGAVLDLSGKEPTVPLLTDAANQAEIVRRSQGVEAIRSIPPNTSPQMLGDVMTNILGTSEPAQRFQILDPTDAPPATLLGVEALKSIEQDWKESADEQQL